MILRGYVQYLGITLKICLGNGGHFTPLKKIDYPHYISLTSKFPLFHMTKEITKYQCGKKEFYSGTGKIEDKIQKRSQSVCYFFS